MGCSAVVCIVILTLSMLAVPLATEAQQPGKVPRIGFVDGGSAAVNGYGLTAFRQGLCELGWVESQNIAIEARWAEGQAARFPDLLAELLWLKVDVIVPVSPAGALAAKQATVTVPIVFVAVGAPLELGLVASFARPGGNITGLAGIAPELSEKRVEFLREVAPHIARVAFLWEATVAAVNFTETEVAARALGIILQSLQVRDPSELDAAFTEVTRERFEGLIVLGGPLTSQHRTRIVELAAKSRLPATYAQREFVDAGGLMAYGASVAAMYRRAATYVDKILKGAKPADLPVERPTKFELIINLKTAQALDLTISPTLLFQADEVIK